VALLADPEIELSHRKGNDMQWNRVNTRRRGEPGAGRQVLNLALVLGLLMSLVLGALAPVNSANAADEAAPVIPFPAEGICSSVPCLSMPFRPNPGIMNSVEVYVVFWLPDGYAFDPDAPDIAQGNELYMSLIKRFFTDIGGSPTLNILTQYYDYENRSPVYRPNVLTLADSYVDTRPYPQSPLSKADIEGGITNAIAVNSWPTTAITPISLDRNLNKLYVVYTPAGVQTCLLEGGWDNCSGIRFNAYHSNFDEAPRLKYMYIPTLAPPSIMGPVFPNNRYADPAIYHTLHELAEAITDPYGVGYKAPVGNYQIGDLCNPAYGRVPIGPQGPDGGNVTLNGNRYLVQLLYSEAVRGCTTGFYGQFINFNAPGDKTFGDAPFTLSADATSLLPVTFTAEGTCTVSNALVTITGTGNCSITASQAGNKLTGGFYDPATPVTRTFSIASVLCQPGTFSASGSEPCASAPAGSYVAGTGATEATLCAAGTFSATSGAIACDPAPVGFYVDSPGAIAATPCAAGSFQDQPGQTSCVQAQPGSFVDTTGAAAASLCPAGTFSANSGALACTPAPAGSFVAGTGAAHATPCPAGSYQPDAGQSSCLVAPAGSFVAGTGASAPTPCAVGTYQDQAGQTSCLLAPAGSFVNVSEAVAPTPCAIGSYQNQLGQTSCVQAQPGSYVATVGATVATPCAAGTFSATPGAIACTLAPAGSFVATTGASAATLCAAGSYQNQTGQTSCLLAQPGYYVATSGATAQTLCPAGTTSAAGATACQPIPVLYTITGFYQPVDMNGVINTVKGGATVPLKFEIFDGTTEVTSTSAVSLSAKQISCPSGAPTEDVEVVATGGTSLRYDASSGQFIYNWQTPKNAGNCYAVTATTTTGSFVTAIFKLK
jgi:hypothetical protein